MTDVEILKREVRVLLFDQYGTIVDMRGGEIHKGSHSPYSRLWRHTGGGALLRLGAHPIGTMLWLKRPEGLRLRGQATKVVSVTAEVADLSRAANGAACEIATGWHDVEMSPDRSLFLDEFSSVDYRLAWAVHADDGEKERNESLAHGIREACEARGVQWDTMTDNGRETFIDDLLHEDRSCGS